MSTFYTNTASIDNLIVTSSAILSGSVTVYGSLTATASSAVSSSFASTASFLSGTVTSASFATTASYVLNSVSSSFATTSNTASYVLQAVSSSFATNSSTASFVLQAVSSSFATNSSTASFLSGTVTSASFASTASFLSGTVTSASFASTASFLSGTVTSASYALNATSASYSSQQFVNVETLSGTKTILSTDPSVQILNPSGSIQTVILPTSALTGSKLEIWNSGIDSSNNYLSVGDGIYYAYNVDPGKKITFRYTGVYVLAGPGTPWQIESETAVSIGNNYNNHTQAVGIGFDATNNYDYGVGIGRSATGNYTYGVGIGHEAYNNYTGGVGVGRGAQGNYTNGVGIGGFAGANRDYGVGIGYQSTNNFSYGAALGAWTNGNSKGVGTVTIGAYTKAERQNEFVTTGTDSTTNKAQSIIQKFKNKALATAAAAFQEIFTDASSGRLTIFASSIYQFRIQINAIEATGFKCKTWEIVGGIKRNASSSTTMMGGAPTYYITSEDSGTTNWDVRVTANDTNEALKIEVKHDSANNVTFSATVWATETRL
jgi:hypothetical protein